MRRLLYLALVLVLLAIPGLAFVRVATSPAYLVRKQFTLIHDGMRRGEVISLMADVTGSDSTIGNSLDIWNIGDEYLLWVWYDWEPEAAQDDGMQMVVVGKFIFRSRGQRSLLDDTLEFLGYPAVHGGT